MKAYKVKLIYNPGIKKPFFKQREGYEGAAEAIKETVSVTRTTGGCQQVSEGELW